MTSNKSLMRAVNQFADPDLTIRAIIAIIFLGALGTAFATFPIYGQLIAYLTTLGMNIIVDTVLLAGTIGGIALLVTIYNHFVKRPME